jgi:hypothetical protein
VDETDALLPSPIPFPREEPNYSVGAEWTLHREICDLMGKLRDQFNLTAWKESEKFN